MFFEVSLIFSFAWMIMLSNCTNEYTGDDELFQIESDDQFKISDNEKHRIPV